MHCQIKKGFIFSFMSQRFVSTLFDQIWVVISELKCILIACLLKYLPNSQFGWQKGDDENGTKKEKKNKKNKQQQPRYYCN